MDHDFKYETNKKRQGLKKQMFNCINVLLTVLIFIIFLKKEINFATVENYFSFFN